MFGFSGTGSNRGYVFNRRYFFRVEIILTRESFNCARITLSVLLLSKKGHMVLVYSDPLLKIVALELGSPGFLKMVFRIF